MVLQIGTGIETVDKVAKIGDLISVQGLMSVIIFLLIVALSFSIKIMLKDKKAMIDEAKEYNTRLEAIGSKFMEQTNKMIIFIELQKNKNHGN